MGLPKEKKDRLSETVTDGIQRVFDNKFKELRKNEVSIEDANDIIRVGAERVLIKPYEEGDFEGLD